MIASNECLAFIRKEETLSPKVAPDTGGKFQIGYGHQCAADAYPDGIDQATAETLLEQDTAACDAAVDALGWDLTQGQHDALVDFAYECGDGALKELAAHGQDQVPAQLPRWVHARVDGVETVLPGMVARRDGELQFWNS
jgi:GH24 family phage-related lysozyme (muramidase)